MPSAPALNLVEGFLRSVRRYPQRPALEIEDRVLDYADLAREASRIQQTILKCEEGENGAPFVGLLAHRSVTAYAGILGILAAGRGYVPLHPKFPLGRTRTMLAASGANVLIVGEESRELLPALLREIHSPLTVLMPETPSPKDSAERLAIHRFIFSERFHPPASSLSERDISSDDWAYLMFTSGSTGVPKGVPITHGNAVAYVNSSCGNFIAEDRFSQFYDLTFDASIGDLFIAWQCGACVVCIPEHSVMAPAKIIRERRLTRWESVPSAIAFMQKLRLLKPALFPDLRISVFGAEALTVSAVATWREAAPHSEIINEYGPTETTNAVLRYRWDERSSPALCHNGYVPLGKPLAGQDICLVDENLNAVGEGELGEIFISGSQVSPGYWNDEERTRKQFVCLPGFGNRIWYRTGDLALRDGDGWFHFKGRRDEQVKIRGYRVELQEIEGVLRKISGFEQVVSMAWPAANGSHEAIAAFLPADARDKEEAILEGCRKHLPEYMVPRKFYYLDQVPLNANGKIDRKKLADLLKEKPHE
jgi:amino acid adenylation domain-containing protein